MNTKTQAEIEAILDNLAAHADERKIDPALIQHAREWLATFRQECAAAAWREPHLVHYDDVGEEISFTWSLPNAMLVVYVAPLPTFTALLQKDTDTDKPENDFKPAWTPIERAAIWRWVNTQKERGHAS